MFAKILLEVGKHGQRLDALYRTRSCKPSFHAEAHLPEKNAAFGVSKNDAWLEFVKFALRNSNMPLNSPKNSSCLRDELG